MDKVKNPNLEIMMLAVNQLGIVADEMVFVGGCATGLLITDEAAPPIRATKDVDVIVQVTSISEYYLLSEKLRKQGFTEDMSEDAPMCRWINDKVILDVMPTEPSILGFGNQWYIPAMKSAALVLLPSGRTVRMVSAPYFLMTKLEAFKGRGNDDYLTSHDIEDFIAVVDGRPELLGEVKQSEHEFKTELSSRCNKLVEDNRFTEAVSGHMPTDETSQLRVARTIEIISEISRL